MVFQIKLRDTIYTVHTEVGDGPARVVLDETRLDEEPKPLETGECDSCTGS